MTAVELAGKTIAITGANSGIGRATARALAARGATVLACGRSAEKLEAFLKVLEPFGVRELVQSGMVAIGRGSRSITDRTLRPVPVPAPPAAV